MAMQQLQWYPGQLMPATPVPDKEPDMKKPRLGRSPREHRDVVEVCKLDRRLKLARKKTQNPVEASLLDGHVRIMSVLYSQNKSIQKVKDSVLEVGNQIDDLARKVELMGKRALKPVEIPRPRNVDLDTVSAHLTILKQTRDKIKRRIETDRTVETWELLEHRRALVPAGTSRDSVGSVASVQEILTNLRELIISSLGFDCLSESSYTQEGSTKIKVRSMEDAYRAAYKMEENLKTFKSKYELSDRKESQLKTGVSRDLLLKKASYQSTPGVKRKRDEEVYSDTPGRRQAGNVKSILVPRRFNFVFPQNYSMQVD